jgi:hypothetical protein
MEEKVGERDWIKREAEELAAKFGVISLYKDSKLRPGDVWKHIGQAVMASLKNSSPDHLGKICSYGLQSSGNAQMCTLFEVHGHGWLPPQESGMNLMRKIAATVLVAEMVSIMRYERMLAGGSTGPAITDHPYYVAKDAVVETIAA